MVLRTTDLCRTLGALLVATATIAYAADKAAPAALDTGYRQMYNLDFPGAHHTFENWETTHPQDPLGPVSNAAAYLFAEFERLPGLESELFTATERFERHEQ